MAKVFSAPKIPAYVPPPAPAPEPVVATPEPTAPEPTPAESIEPTPDEIRLRNILARKRGVAGTVLTSLSGLITTGTNAEPQRKKLLGE